MPATPTSTRIRRMWLQLVVDRGERQRDQHGAARAGAEREHAQVGAPHGAVGEQLAAAARGDRPFGAVGCDRGRGALAARDIHSAVRVDELHVPRRPTEAGGRHAAGKLLEARRLRCRRGSRVGGPEPCRPRRPACTAAAALVLPVPPPTDPLSPLGVPGAPGSGGAAKAAARWRREESTWPRRSERTATYTTTAASSTATATARPATAAMRARRVTRGPRDRMRRSGVHGNGEAGARHGSRRT